MKTLFINNMDNKRVDAKGERKKIYADLYVGTVRGASQKCFNIIYKVFKT